tara:strand:+ start:971 stop:1495 length:525 start_codon:yes stop_codon:yes gene_type:complete
MNAGKTTMLLGSAHNYEQRKKRIILLTSSFDTRFGQNIIKSRTGIQKPCKYYTTKCNLKTFLKSNLPLECVFIDEAQFLTYEQIWQLVDFIAEENVYVKCYGLRTDFKGNVFEGSQVLLGIADELVHVKTICDCGKYATMNQLLIKESDTQIQIGGENMYESLCRKCWLEANKK